MLCLTHKSFLNVSLQEGFIYTVASAVSISQNISVRQFSSVV